MPSPAFTLSVPADERLRGLVADVVRAWLSLTGRASSDTERFVASIDAAVGRIAADPLGDVEVVVETTPAGVDVRLTSGDRHETLHAAL